MFIPAVIVFPMAPVTPGTPASSEKLATCNWFWLKEPLPSRESCSIEAMKNEPPCPEYLRIEPSSEEDRVSDEKTPSLNHQNTARKGLKSLVPGDRPRWVVSQTS